MILVLCVHVRELVLRKEEVMVQLPEGRGEEDESLSCFWRSTRVTTTELETWRREKRANTHSSSIVHPEETAQLLRSKAGGTTLLAIHRLLW